MESKNKKAQSFSDTKVRQRSFGLSALIFKIARKFLHANSSMLTVYRLKKILAPKHCIILLFSFLYFYAYLLAPSVSEAATLYFEPKTNKLQMGQEFIVKVKIDTDNECVNAVNADIVFDKNLLVPKEFLTGNSIINVWVKKPEIKEGEVSFSGGMPGGYCGKISGDPGENDILGEIIFQVPEFLVSKKRENFAKIKFLNTSKAFLNDGLGTEAKLKLVNAEYEILGEKEEAHGEFLEKKIIGTDKIPPEPFGILVLKDPQVFGGKYFIVFSTADKQTGISHYEVKEGNGEWEEAESPHLLKDQTLQSIIKVKAVDKAGNERIIGFFPYVPKGPPAYFRLIVIILVAFVSGIIYWIIKYAKQKYGDSK